MRAMVLQTPGTRLEWTETPSPRPATGQVRLEVLACGVCRTDLHIVDGELTEPVLPLIPGHEIVGIVRELGPGVTELQVGQVVGVPWLGWTCGECRYCTEGRENLCDQARFTGYQLPGGFADETLVDARYALRLPDALDPAAAAPLLCAGLIGYRTLRMAGNARAIGIYGFGAAAHLVAQIARYEDRKVFAFTRDGDERSRKFARDLGVAWAGGTSQEPPEPLDAALIFAPAGELVPRALQCVRKGGVVVCGGIHMSDIPSFPYQDLWGERMIRSVANLTRQDGHDFLEIAARAGVRSTVTLFPLRDANIALDRLRSGQIEGAAVIAPSASP